MVRIVDCRPSTPALNSAHNDEIFFPFKIEENCTLTTFVEQKLSVSQES